MGTSVKTISIPYGAIKRKFGGELLLKLHQISIPYGAIKRKHIICNNLTFAIFQFLMVRLKVSLNALSSDLVNNFNSLWCD